MSDSTATIISSLAATASAIAAIFAIKQSIIQRRMSYKPQFFIEEFHDTFYGRNTPVFEDNIKSNGDRENYELELVNVGNGVAQNISYKWVYDYHSEMLNVYKAFLKLKDFLSKNNIDKSPYTFSYKIEKTEGKELISFRRNNKDVSYPTKLEDYINYVIPKNQSGAPVTIKASQINTNIIYNLINFKNNTGEDINSLHGPQVVIKYQDAGGAFITDRFESEFVICDTEYKNNQSVYRIMIKFNRVDSRWTMRLLQRIRRGYENWLDSEI